MLVLNKKAEKPLGYFDLKKLFKDHPGQEYIHNVYSGDIKACKSIKLTIERAIKDHRGFYGDTMYFDPEAAEYVIEYCTLCNHTKGKWANKPFEHSPYQTFITSELFGWKLTKTNKRRFRTAFIEIPKKNGKSTYLSTLAVYMFHGDEEQGAEVYALASQIDQAKIVFNEASRMIKKSPELSNEISVYVENLYIPSTESVFCPLPHDVSAIDGKNAHCNIVDELHQHKSSDLWNLIENSMGSREQPLSIAITTSGNSVISVGYMEHEHAMDILEGKVDIPSHFVYVSSKDKEDDWRDDETAEKTNPNLGVSVFVDDIKRVRDKALHKPHAENDYRRYRLNEWVGKKENWLSTDLWSNTLSDPPPSYAGAYSDPDFFTGRECYGGMDLALSDDMSAFCLIFPIDSYLFAMSWCYTPEASVQRNVQSKNIPYDIWIRQGLLTATPGDLTDFGYIENDIDEICKTYNPRDIGFDPYKATQIASNLENKGQSMVAVRQTELVMNDAMVFLQSKIAKSQFYHNKNKIMTWNALNICVRKNKFGDIAPDKQRSPERIDLTTAALIAVNRMLNQDSDYKKESVYASRMPAVVKVNKKQRR